MKKHVLCPATATPTATVPTRRTVPMAASASMRRNAGPAACRPRWAAIISSPKRASPAGRPSLEHPIDESMDALSAAYALLKSHEVIDLLIIMLGTNDVKERFGANAACIAAGLERLILKCKSVDCSGAEGPQHSGGGPAPYQKMASTTPSWARAVWRDPPVLAEQFRVIAERQGVHFLDAEGCEFNRIDFMHLTRHGHAQLAEKLAELVPTLL